MQASLSSTRSFFRRPGKFRSLHRKQKSIDSTGTSGPAAPSELLSGSPSPLDGDSVSSLQLQDESALASQKWADLTPPPSGGNVVTEAQSPHGQDEESIPRKSEETMKISLKPEVAFKGLPEYPEDLSNQGLIDDKYLKAFGIHMENGRGGEGRRTGPQGTGIMMTPPPDMDEGIFEMEVREHTTHEGRPGLQVSIPHQRALAAEHSALEDKGKSVTVDSASSPPLKSQPSLSDNPNPNPFGLTGSQISIVSPLSATDQPQVKRPPSMLSIGHRTGDERRATTGTPAMKSANSMSSNDTSELDGRSSGLSERSSMSSVNSDITAKREHPPLRPRIVDATAMRVESAQFQTVSGPHPPNVARAGLTQTSSQDVRRQNSVTSMKSTSALNVNKPLPPEPTSGLNKSGSLRASFVHTHSRTPSRSSSVTVRQDNAAATPVHEIPSSASVRTISVVRRGSKGSTSRSSLRSRYSPKDVDSQGDRMSRTSCSTPKTPYSNSASPSRSQTSLLPDQKLHTIKEDSPRDSRAVALSREPKQVARGPMRMEPSRRAPQPPSHTPQRYNTVSAERPERMRFMKRSQSSNHIGAKIREDAPVSLHRRMTSQGTGSTSKANRILGKSGSSSPVRRDISKIFEPRRMVLESPMSFSRASTPSTTDGRATPELEARPDAHFEEIKKRLELLSPKDDPSVTFLAFHEKNVSAPSGLGNATASSSGPDLKPSPEAPGGGSRLDPTAGSEHRDQIAELQAHRTPSPRRAPPPPVELEGSAMAAPVELGLPSPKATAAFSPSSTSVPVPPIPVPPVPADVSLRRGRLNNSNPQSSVSGGGKARSLHSQRSLKARSLASLAASEIPEIYAGLPTPSLSLRPSMTAEEVEQLITADAAERVLLHILENLDNLQDLFAAALVSRGFYRTFKRNELHLLKRAIFRMSPAAWELREMSIPFSELDPGADNYTPGLYFRHYVQDLLTMVELKAMILESCKSFLRQDTILAMEGEADDRSPAIDEAFWRVWTFCRIFGCGTHREDDIVGQMDWLKGGIMARHSTDTRTLAMTDELARNSVLFNPPKGFARGNGHGLSTEELYDMTEIWTCLGVLVRVYQGKRKEAREYGVFDNAHINEGDAKKEAATLEEWTHYLMTLAPSTILDVASPLAPVPAMLAHARAQGYTSWKPPAPGFSRSTFLKEAVSRVYEEQLALTRSASTLPKALSEIPKVPMPTACDSPPSPGTALASRQRVAQHAAELRAKKQDPNYWDVPVSTERPMSNYKDVLNRLEALSSSADPRAPSVPRLPGLAARLSRRMPKVHISSPTRVRASPASASSSVVSLDAPATAEPGGEPPTATLDSRAASPIARAKTGGRFSSLRGRVASRGETPPRHEPAEPGAHSGTLVEVTDEKVPVPPVEGDTNTLRGTHASAPPAVPKGPQVRDPVDLAVERLVAMGFDEARAKRALAETDSGNRINFDNALTRLVKEKEKLERLERLRKMG